MTTTAIAVDTSGARATSPSSAARFGRLRHDWPALPVVALALVCHFWALTSVGWGNAYYAAAVRSMSQNWHNFLYASFDPGGFVSVDKPPFSLWVQALSARLFGYSQLSLLVPEALAGTLAVLLVYLAVRSLWGRGAGVIAAGALALMPINVVVNHTNNTDSILVLLMTAGAVTVLRAVRSGRLGWLLAAAALSGTAMTAKMLAAVPLMPALVVAYVWCAPRRWTVRLAHTAAAIAVLAAAGLWWFALVDLTPKDARPYVGSSATNSAFQLAFERNGVNQVEGATGAGARGRAVGPGARAGAPPLAADGAAGRSPAGGRGFAIPRLGFNGGAPGPFRLFNAELGTQIGWLIPLGLTGGLVALAAVGWRGSARLASVVVFGGWFLSGALVFSITKGVVHPYYLANIGPPLAGLIGAGVGGVQRLSGRRRVFAVLLPAGLLLTAFTQAKLLARPEWEGWRPAVRTVAIPAVALSAAAVALVIALRRTDRWRRWAVPGASAIALVAPGLWTQAALSSPLSGPLPYAAPRNGSTVGAAPAGGLRPNGGFTFLGGSQAKLVAFLQTNRGSARWLVGVQSAGQAESIIIEHGEAVLSMGGFSGSDPILTTERLTAMIRAGDVRYFLVPEGGLGGPGFAVPGAFPGGLGGAAPAGRPGASGGRFGRRLPGTAAAPDVSGTLGGLLPGIDGARGGGGAAGIGSLLPGTGRAGATARTSGNGIAIRGPGPGNGGLTSFITQRCAVVPESEWSAGGATSGPGAGETSFPGGPSSASFALYDCGSV